MLNLKEYLICKTVEESGEIVQAGMKCMLYTSEHIYSEYKSSNIERMQDEIMDFQAIHMLAIAAGAFKDRDFNQELDKRFARILTYMGAAVEIGQLDPTALMQARALVMEIKSGVKK